MSFDTDMKELQAKYQHKRVRIRKGATVHRDMHPRNHDKDMPRKLGRTVTVECFSVFPAFDEDGNFGREKRHHHPAQLTYAGSGGYWVDVELDPEYVEVIDDQA